MTVSANVSLDLFAAVMTAMIGASTFGKKLQYYLLNRVFQLLCFFILSMLLGDAAGWLFEGLAHPWYPVAVRIADFVLYACGFLSLADFTLYVYLRIVRMGHMSKLPLLLAVGIGSLGLLLLIISQFTGILYYFDSDNIYHRGSWFLYTQAALLLIIVINTAVILAKRRFLPMREIVAMLLYAWLPLLASTIQFFHYGISITYPISSLSTLFIYINIQSEAAHLMRRRSEHDALTGLCNRVRFNEKSLHEYWNLHSLGVICFDVNDLKSTNDSYGHDAGDQLLKLFASSLRAITNRYIHAYRMGGDEFTVVICNCEEKDVADVVNLWREQLLLLNKTAAIPCSVALGTAWGGEGYSLDRLLQEADEEMYQNKKEAKTSQPKPVIASEPQES